MSEQMKLSAAIREISNKTGGIYLFACVNGKFYIGQTKQFRNRIRQHLESLIKKSHKNPILQSAWNVYGGEGFSVSILETIEDISRQSLCIAENKWLQTYRGNGAALFNICEAAESPLGVKHSPEFGKRISEYQTGRKLSDKTKQRMSEAHKGNKNSLGFKHSPETRQKQSLMMRGRKLAFHIKPNARKQFVFISPTGEITKVIGLQQFCKEKGLLNSGMSQLHSGNLNTYKGWKKYE